jgi:two-component system chemotaxis response regulator CheB
VKYDIVVIGTSAGGLAALERVLAGLPGSFPLPLLIVQHRSRESDLLCEVLAARSPLPVREVLDKEQIEAGVVYLAPPDYHVLVDEGAFSLSSDEPVRFARPSIDVSFESAVDAFGARVIGVVLTGANEDGAAGLRRVHAEGGLALVQDPTEAEVKRMPSAAAAAVPTARVLSLDAIGAALRTAAAEAGPLARRPA